MEKCKGGISEMLQLQDVITPANRHLAKEGDLGFVSDWITELIEIVNNHKTATVVELQMNPDEPANIEKPFVANATKYRYFYKLESIPSETQKAKMMQIESKDQILHLMDSADMLKAMNKQAEKDSALKSYAETCRSMSKPFVPHTHTFKLTNELRWHIVEKSKPVLEQKCVCIECGEEYWEPVITFVEL